VYDSCSPVVLKIADGSTVDGLGCKFRILAMDFI
jgi:hypothetical protein